jgi:DNA repair exonuclease SbcCD ATPase subunit
MAARDLRTHPASGTPLNSQLQRLGALVDHARSTTTTTSPPRPAPAFVTFVKNNLPASLVSCLSASDIAFLAAFISTNFLGWVMYARARNLDNMEDISATVGKLAEAIEHSKQALQAQTAQLEQTRTAQTEALSKELTALSEKLESFIDRQDKLRQKVVARMHAATKKQTQVTQPMLKRQSSVDNISHQLDDLKKDGQNIASQMAHVQTDIQRLETRSRRVQEQDFLLTAIATRARWLNDSVRTFRGLQISLHEHEKAVALHKSTNPTNATELDQTYKQMQATLSDLFLNSRQAVGQLLQELDDALQLLKTSTQPKNTPPTHPFFSLR